MYRIAQFLPALFAATLLHGQAKPSAAIPATQPTQSVSDLPSAQPPVTAAQTGDTRVTWNGSQLTIVASGEPMPEVLGRVARETGMKVVGGVPDEHLYGTYGPGSVQTVLAQLFEGLSINMMLVNESPTVPKELILTSRTGGPTPPSTRQVQDTWQPSRQPQTIRPIGQTFTQRPATATVPQPGFPAQSTSPTRSNAFTNAGSADTTPAINTDAGNNSTTQPQSPNGVKTPEQIFEELRQRQQNAQSH